MGYRDRLAQLYYRQKRYARAIDEWNGILELNPQSVGALLGIARSYEQVKAWKGAMSYYQKALDLRPGDASIIKKIEEIKKNNRAANASGRTARPSDSMSSK